MNILSLCIFPFAAKPLLQQVTGISKKQYEAMMEERKKIVPQIHYSINKKVNHKTIKHVYNKKICLHSLFQYLLFSCNNNENQFDASGTFEADEVIVSSQLSGQLLAFNIDEGDTLSKGEIVGKIDSTDVFCKKNRYRQLYNLYMKKQSDVQPQIKLLQDQLAVQQTQLN